MATKSTGRPVGRPKGTRTAVVELETMSFKAPAELLARVRKYAKEHRQSVSEMVRDGLLWRLESDPLAWRYGGQTEGAVAYDGNTGNTHMSDESAEVLREVQASVARLEAQLQVVGQLLEPRGVQGGSEGDTRNTENAPSGHRAVQGSDSGNIGNTENAPRTVLAPMVPRVKADKAEVLARLQQMRDTGLDSTQIAMALQVEGVPTLSGKGEWHSGTVRKLLRG